MYIVQLTDGSKMELRETPAVGDKWHRTESVPEGQGTRYNTKDEAYWTGRAWQEQLGLPKGLCEVVQIISYYIHLGDQVTTYHVPYYIKMENLTLAPNLYAFEPACQSLLDSPEGSVLHWGDMKFIKDSNSKITELK